jgi:hypothetical protein
LPRRFPVFFSFLVFQRKDFGFAPSRCWEERNSFLFLRV